MLVLVNPASRGGTGGRRWHQVRRELRAVCGEFSAVEAAGPADILDAVSQGVAQGETRFVAAGGDGTVNLVMAGLVAAAPNPDALSRLTLGAIGLGSSNDFHKVPTARRIGGHPCRLDFAGAAPHDVGRLRYEDGAGSLRDRLWIINASIGTTAEGNWLFNHPDRLLRTLKRVSAAGAMALAAARCVIGFTPQEISLTLDGGEPRRCRLRNLGIVKNPHFTGALRYDSPHEPSSGRFFVHLLDDVPLPSLVLTLLCLARGRFRGRPGASSRRAERLVASAPQPFAVETDGEVLATRRAEFSLLPGALKVCA